MVPSFYSQNSFELEEQFRNSELIKWQCSRNSAMREGKWSAVVLVWNLLHTRFVQHNLPETGPSVNGTTLPLLLNFRCIVKLSNIESCVTNIITPRSFVKLWYRGIIWTSMRKSHGKQWSCESTLTTTKYILCTRFNVTIRKYSLASVSKLVVTYSSLLVLNFISYFISFAITVGSWVHVFNPNQTWKFLSEL